VGEPDSTLYRHVVRELRQGRLTPFLGAGVNLVGIDLQAGYVLGERLPSSSELAHQLAEHFDFPVGDDEIDLVRVAQWVELDVGRSDLEEFLRRVFNRDFEPTPVHELLASTPAFVRQQPVQEFPLIITTNYDDALERAFAERGEELDVLTYVALGADKGLFRHTAPDGEQTVITVGDEYTRVSLKERAAIVKLHGAVHRSSDDDEIEEDSYVVTEDDYIECLSNPEIVRNLPANVAERMRRCHYLFLGYSLRDWNMRVMLRRFSQDRAKQVESWAVVSNPDKLEQKAWRLRHVEMYDLDLGLFAQGLAAQMADAAAAGSHSS
jgi:hypothetical protein